MKLLSKKKINKGDAGEYVSILAEAKNISRECIKTLDIVEQGLKDAERIATQEKHQGYTAKAKEDRVALRKAIALLSQIGK